MKQIYEIHVTRKIDACSFKLAHIFVKSFRTDVLNINKGKNDIHNFGGELSIFRGIF